MFRTKSVVLAGVLASISGCAGVPRLYAPPEKGVGTNSLPVAPKVEDIVRHLACELRNAAIENRLGERNYIVTVFLTLQVEDALHATPSLSFIDPLKAEGTSLTVLASGDLGGERKRTFTTTYYLETRHLLGAPAEGNVEPVRNPECDGNRLYSLESNLGLSEIVRDGVGAYALRYGKDQVGVHPDTSVDKNTFGSRVIFVVNKSLGALGPTWSLKHFKGPGGSGGLLNAKRLNTDDLIVTFALQSADVTSQAAVAIADQKLRDAGKAVDQAEKSLSAARAAFAQMEARAAEARAVLARPVYYSSSQKQKQERAEAQETLRQAEKARQAAETAQTRLDAREAERQAAAANAASERQAAARSNNAQAVREGQDLLNSMILQSLQPR